MAIKVKVKKEIHLFYGAIQQHQGMGRLCLPKKKAKDVKVIAKLVAVLG